MNKDLTIGNPSSVLWRFCLPLFGSVIFQQLYNIADSLVAGKFIGEHALAAVGNSYEITLIFIAFAFGCNMGCSVIVSRFFGAKALQRMKTAISTTYLTTAALLFILMLFGFICGTPLLRLIRTPQEIFADSSLYLRIYILGLPFLFFYNIATGIFSALGDSKTPFLFLACSSTANIFVDILFVTAFHMGVAGVAWATFLCQGVSCLLAVLVVYRRLLALDLSADPGKPQRFSFEILLMICSVAIPSILQQGFISVGNIIIQSIINGFGPGVIAGYAAAIKLNNLVITSYTTLGNGMSNYAAQNLGANKTSRIPEGFLAGLRMALLLCVPITLLYLFGCRPMLLFFMDSPSDEALGTGIFFLRLVAPFYCICAAKLISDGILRGTGRMKQFMFGTFTDLILRVGLSFLFSLTALGSRGIWLSWPIGWTVAAVMSLSFYRSAAKAQFMV